MGARQLELASLTESFQNKEEIVDRAVGFMQNAASLWRIAGSENRSWFQEMVIPAGITVNDSLNFGTVELGASFAEAHLLAAEYEATKKTQNDTESLVVTPRRIELLFPG